jgi:hypothetical protein
MRGTITSGGARPPQGSPPCRPLCPLRAEHNRERVRYDNDRTTRKRDSDRIGACGYRVDVPRADNTPTEPRFGAPCRWWRAAGGCLMGPQHRHNGEPRRRHYGLCRAYELGRELGGRCYQIGRGCNVGGASYLIGDAGPYGGLVGFESSPAHNGPHNASQVP